MPTPAQIGKNQYKEALRKGRVSTQQIREALRRILDENPGPQTLATLITRIAVGCGNIEAVFAELDEIGRQTKSSGTSKGE